MLDAGLPWQLGSVPGVLDLRHAVHHFAAGSCRPSGKQTQKRMILDLRDAGELDDVGLNFPERTLKKGHVLAPFAVESRDC
jgi:hypothetical protein